MLIFKTGRLKQNEGTENISECLNSGYVNHVRMKKKKSVSNLHLDRTAFSAQIRPPPIHPPTIHLPPPPHPQASLLFKNPLIFSSGWSVTHTQVRAHAVLTSRIHHSFLTSCTVSSIISLEQSQTERFECLPRVFFFSFPQVLSLTQRAYALIFPGH